MDEIDDHSVDFVLADLPYGTTQNAWDVVIPFEPLWKQYKRVVKKNGAICLFSSQPFTTLLNYSNLAWYRYEWIWMKSRATGFLDANRKPLKKHEIISVFYEESPAYHPQGIVPYNKLNRRGKSGTGSNWGQVQSNNYVQKFTNYPVSTIYFASVQDKLHPTQKPLDLLKFFIATYTNPGELVLDNCAGSCGVAIAAKELKRSWICIEISPEFCDNGQQRFEKHFEGVVNEIVSDDFIQ